MFTET